MSLPASRAEAKAAGSPRFFTGVPCKRGHIAERYTSIKSCVECARLLSAEFYKAHKDEVNARARIWARKNKAKECARRRKRFAEKPQAMKDARDRHYAKHSARLLARCAKWRAEHPEKIRAYAAERRATKRLATPAWADFDLIDKVYEKALQLERETGIAHHVDHIVPLRGKNVSGLHVHYNLQAIPAAENGRKYNLFMEA